MNRQAVLEVFFRLETGNWEVDWKGRRELETDLLGPRAVLHRGRGEVSRMMSSS